MNGGKRFYVTEKQLRELEELIEAVERTPAHINMDLHIFNSEIEEAVSVMAENAMADAAAGPARDLRWWKEDIEQQEAGEMISADGQEKLCAMCGAPLESDWQKISIYKSGLCVPICAKCRGSIVAEIGWTKQEAGGDAV